MSKKELIKIRMKNIFYLTLTIFVILLVLTISFFVENTILMIMLYFIFSICLIALIPFMFKIYDYSQDLKKFKGE